MRVPLYLWLPGSRRIKQHLRLRAILGQLTQPLADLGYDLVLRSLRDDPFDPAKGAFNIWLASDIVDMPPIAGVNILWFLDQIKVVPHTVLLAHDALWSASSDHCRFLSGWIGPDRPIAQIGWPVAPVTAKVVPDGPILHLAPPVRLTFGDHALLATLPTDAAALSHVFARHPLIYAHLPLRERMTGFPRYEEIVALATGCRLVSPARRGLPDALRAAMHFVPDDAMVRPLHPPPVSGGVDPADFLRGCTPEAIARQMVSALAAAAAPREPRRTRPVAIVGTDEQALFLRDRQRFLDLWDVVGDRIMAGLHGDRDVDLSQPFVVAPASVLAQSDWANAPFTDLTGALCALSALASGQALPPDTRAALARIARILWLHRADLATPSTDVVSLADLPWPSVLTASCEPVRDHLVLTGALNGHNLYRFDQKVGLHRILSPMADMAHSPSVPPKRLAVFLHAFYLPEAEAVLHLMAASLKVADLFITTDTADKKDALTRCLAGLDWAQSQIDVVPNVGRDIYPKVLHLADVQDRYDLVLHIHTKKSPHTPALTDWAGLAQSALFATPDRVAQCIAAFDHDPGLGILYPGPPDILHPAMAWTRNLRIAEVVAAKLGLDDLPGSQTLEFPAGSMFWARPAALRALGRIGLAAYHFAPESGQVDGTLAHAIERLLGVCCLAGGMRMARAG
jgi:Rhamnan synthesis protein F